MQTISNMKKYVVFNLENEEYGIDILRVREIIEMKSITRVPKSCDFVRGVINLRGEVIPIVDLRKKFALSEGEDTENTRIIVVSIDDITVGLVIDSSSEVQEIENDFIESTPVSVGNIDQGYIAGIGKVSDRLIILLDVARVLSNTSI